MTVIIYIATQSNPKQLKAKDMQNLYKKAGFRSAENFGVVASWSLDDSVYTVHGKRTGSAMPNLYAFPSPLNTGTVIGNCIVLKNDGVDDLLLGEWQRVVNQLLQIETGVLTASGYRKDGFVVSDDDDGDVDHETDDDKVEVDNRESERKEVDVRDVVLSEVEMVLSETNDKDNKDKDNKDNKDKDNKDKEKEKKENECQQKEGPEEFEQDENSDAELDFEEYV